MALGKRGDSFPQGLRSAELFGSSQLLHDEDCTQLSGNLRHRPSLDDESVSLVAAVLCPIALIAQGGARVVTGWYQVRSGYDSGGDCRRQPERWLSWAI